MTDEQIEDMLEYCPGIRKEDVLALIKRQMAEICRLEYTLLGVMHSVDKWLEGDELKQDEVNRAITMREKTLHIVESLRTEVAREIFEELEKYVEVALMNGHIETPILCIGHGAFAELKKKYTEEQK